MPDAEHADYNCNSFNKINTDSQFNRLSTTNTIPVKGIKPKTKKMKQGIPESV